MNIKPYRHFLTSKRETDIWGKTPFDKRNNPNHWTKHPTYIAYETTQISHLGMIILCAKRGDPRARQLLLYITTARMKR